MDKLSTQERANPLQAIGRSTPSFVFNPFRNKNAFWAYANPKGGYRAVK